MRRTPLDVVPARTEARALCYPFASVMTKAESNRRNARRSTGPRTPEGRAVSALNGVSHGLRAATVVLPGESEDEWQAFLAKVLTTIAPVGAVETCLAERVASLFWRLRRADGYEARSVALAAERVEDDYLRKIAWEANFETHPPEPAESVEGARGAAEQAAQVATLLHALPDLGRTERVPTATADLAVSLLYNLAEQQEVFDEDALTLPGPPLGDHTWTVAMIQDALHEIAGVTDIPRDTFLKIACKRAREEAEHARVMFERIERETAERLTRAARDIECMRQARAAPSGAVMEQVQRYEAHLQRALMGCLHELERQQRKRAGLPVPPPAALDVNVSTGSEPNPEAH